MDSNIQAAINRGEATREAKSVSEIADQAQQRAESEKAVATELDNAAAWVARTLPTLVEEHTAAGKSLLELGRAGLRQEPLKEAILRIVGKIEGLKGYSKVEPGPYANEDTVAYYEVANYYIEWA